MAYEKMNVVSVLNHIASGKMYLPAIQRKYVWTERQIIRLMDSIMLGYPIGTFLFWKVGKEVVNDKNYSMYQFIKDYHERDCFNNPPAPKPLLNPASGENIYAVLDGQQRLTSLYIALQGSYRSKLPKKHWNNDDAYPYRELYIDLRHLEEDTDEEYTYRFAFLTEYDANTQNKQEENTPLWFKVKEILKCQSETEVNKRLIKANGWIDEIDQVSDNLMLLFQRLVRDDLINYFEINHSDSIDDVLDIFIRVNSGGTTLSKTDLLYSTIVCHWDGARDEVDSLLSTINRIGEGFSFTNDFIMRTCLYLLKQNNGQYFNLSLKVESFKEENVHAIRDEWDNIKDAIITTTKLLNEFGFYSGNITSYAAVTPIVFYKYHGGVIDADTKPELRKYFVMAQLRQIFGSSNTTALTRIRTALEEMSGKFNYALLQDIRFSGDKTLRCTDTDIESWLDTYEIGPYTFMLLSLLYPHLKYGQVGFHQDHLHPYTAFEGKKLEGLILPDGSTITPEKTQEWQHLRNTIPNLQLLESRDNESKNMTPLEKWLSVPENRSCMKYLPANIPLDLCHFEEFYTARKALMYDKLKSILL